MTGRSLRVVHVVSSLRIGGMEQFVLRLAQLQRTRGHEASVLAIAGGALHEEAVRRSVPVRVLGQRLMPLRVMAAVAHFAEVRPDIVHVHNPTSLHYGLLSSYVGKPRIVFTDHAQTKGLVRVPPAREWARVQAFASVSAHTAGQAPVIGYHGAVTVIYNGVELPAPAADRPAHRAQLTNGDGVLVLNAASFHPVKGHDLLVQAAALLRARRVPVTMVCAGDGPERPAIEALARAQGLGPEAMRFLGFTHEVDRWLRAADLFVLPSRAEGFPMSLLEAMSHGVAPICTDVGGNTELVQDGRSGLVVPADDAVSLAGAIERLAVEPSLRAALGEAARARVATTFSFERTADGYARLYDAGTQGVPA